MSRISEAELIINSNGSIYHLNLLPEDIAPIVITVGDPDRVAEVSKYFDSIDLKKGKREFITHTGYLGKKRITVLSTGIGTDNIDIVLNELDALVNIDFSTRTIKQDLISLDIIRIGTSGAVQADVPMGTILASAYGLGFDALMNYYRHDSLAEEAVLLTAINSHFNKLEGINPYLAAGSSRLLNTLAKDLEKGITATLPGFYGPQGRCVRAPISQPDLIEQLHTFKHVDARITNLEMETAGIYAMSRILGHQAISINAILASRIAYKFSEDPQRIVEGAIKYILERL